MFKASVVSYLNTKPLFYGLQQSGMLGEIDLSLDIPSQTAAKLLAGSIDFGLVPVAIIPQLGDYEIITDYCIGTEGVVKTVGLYSQCPMEELETIYLDYHSRTSVQLLQLLAREYWQISPEFVPAKQGYIQKIGGKTGGLIIGDRAIEWRKVFKYEYDLGEQWRQFTGLPFVFAAWVSVRKLPTSFIKKLNTAFELGVNSIATVAQQYKNAFDKQFDIEGYLSDNINYHLNEDKREALHIFLTYLRAKEAAVF